MARIVWSAHALEDLKAILAYISRDAPLAARRFGEAILRRADTLRFQPEIGGFIYEDKRRRYRELIQGNYRLIYRVSKDVVVIVAMHHAARCLDLEGLE